MNFAKTGPELYVFGRAGSSQGRKRPIIIDGQNVAVEHGKERSHGKKFSAKGIDTAVKFFKSRGHTEIVAWLPRKFIGRFDFPDNKEILERLEKNNTLKYTMDRKLHDGRRIKSYDDR